MENNNHIADKAHSAAFTGHRLIAVDRTDAIKASLHSTILKMLNKGIRNFYCGMAMGFDMLAAEVVISMKKEHPEITLSAVIPFKGQSDRWQPLTRRKYSWLLDHADVKIVLSKVYYNGCFLARNQFMLDHACRLIEYYDGSTKGGTYYTHVRAERMDMPITNIY